MDMVVFVLLILNHVPILNYLCNTAGTHDNNDILRVELVSHGESL